MSYKAGFTLFKSLAIRQETDQYNVELFNGYIVNISRLHSNREFKVASSKCSMQR